MDMNNVNIEEIVKQVLSGRQEQHRQQLHPATVVQFLKQPE